MEAEAKFLLFLNVAFDLLIFNVPGFDFNSISWIRPSEMSLV